MWYRKFYEKNFIVLYNIAPLNSASSKSTRGKKNKDLWVTGLSSIYSKSYKCLKGHQMWQKICYIPYRLTQGSGNFLTERAINATYFEKYFCESRHNICLKLKITVNVCILCSFNANSITIVSLNSFL